MQFPFTCSTPPADPWFRCCARPCRSAWRACRDPGRCPRSFDSVLAELLRRENLAIRRGLSVTLFPKVCRNTSGVVLTTFRRFVVSYPARPRSLERRTKPPQGRCPAAITSEPSPARPPPDRFRAQDVRACEPHRVHLPTWRPQPLQHRSR